MSLQSKIKKVARELAMEEMHKKHGHRGGAVDRIGLAYHGYGEGLDDSYGLTEVGGRIHHRRHRSASRGRAGIIAEGMRHRSSSRHRSVSRGRGEAMMRHRSASRSHSRSRSRSVGGRVHHSMSRHRSMSRGRGEKLHIRRRSHSRGRALDDSYGLATTGGLMAYGMRKPKHMSKRKPSTYNLFVKKYLLANPGHSIAEAAMKWRDHK